MFVPGFDVIRETYGEWETRTVEYRGEEHEVELLARLSPFETWDVTGDFSGEPIEDGDSVQVWWLDKGT